MHQTSRRRQRGAVIITVFLLMLFLLGFMGIALDFGKLFVVKSELQTAVDSCALAAAQELDLQPTAIERATSAGLTAGNLNAVNFQSTSWSGQGQLVAADITFKDTNYATTTDPGLAHYVECAHQQPAVQMWLLKALGAWRGNTTLFPATNNVWASAVATRAHGQTTCPIPVALRPRETCGGPCPKPNYGFVPGEWIPVLTAMGQQNIEPGHIGWANLDEDKPQAASETVAEMNGKCGSREGDNVVLPTTSGGQAVMVEPWNYRFGIYKKLPDFATDPSYMRPDFSGYAYTAVNWPSQFNAWKGSDPSAGPTAENFEEKRRTFSACAPDDTLGSCYAITGLNVQTGGFKGLAKSGTGTASHGAWGTNRRIVTAPIINASKTIVDFACLLMLQPLTLPFADVVQLEFIGNASDPTSPCSFSGMPGGAAGPLVPALVR